MGAHGRRPLRELPGARDRCRCPGRVTGGPRRSRDGLATRDPRGGALGRCPGDRITLGRFTRCIALGPCAVGRLTRGTLRLFTLGRPRPSGSRCTLGRFAFGLCLPVTAQPRHGSARHGSARHDSASGCGRRPSRVQPRSPGSPGSRGSPVLHLAGVPRVSASCSHPHPAPTAAAHPAHPTSRFRHHPCPAGRGRGSPRGVRRAVRRGRRGHLRPARRSSSSRSSPRKSSATSSSRSRSPRTPQPPTPTRRLAQPGRRRPSSSPSG